MSKSRLFAWIAILSLPAAVWGIVVWTSQLQHPWLLVAVAVVFLALVVLFIHRLAPVWYTRYRDARFATGLLAFLLILPVVALLSGINALGSSVSRIETWELSEIYNRGPSDGVYLFLWTGNELHKERVALDHPLAQALPGDSIYLDYRRGLLGFEYLRNVYPAK